MKRTRQHWRIATAWTAVVALLFHVTLLLVPVPAQSADGLGNSVVLCSSFGMYSVSLADLDGDQVPTSVPENGSTPIGSLFCPICSAAQFADAAIPSVETILPPPSSSVERVEYGHDENVAAVHRITGSGPRAPPSIA